MPPRAARTNRSLARGLRGGHPVTTWDGEVAVGRFASCSLVALLALAGACSSTTPRGSTGVCLATSADDPAAADELTTRSASHRGLVRVPEDEELEEPEAFEDCARGMPAWGQFIDEDGVHIWLAAVARLAARDLVPAAVFDAVGEGGTLDASLSSGWTTSESLIVSDDDGVVLALHNQAALSEEGLEAGGLTVSLSGATALASPTVCGFLTERGVRFTTDDGERTVSNGQVEGALVNGTEIVIANVFTFETAGSDCTDGGADRLSASWVAVDASL